MAEDRNPHFEIPHLRQSQLEIRNPHFEIRNSPSPTKVVGEIQSSVS